MPTYGLYDDDEIEAKKQELEDEGKITYEACIAYVTEDYETYHEEMRKAAEDVLLGIEPDFIDEDEIDRLTELYATDPVTDDKDYEIEAKIRELEDEGKFTYMAYVAYISKDYDAYDEAMRDAAESISLGIEPQFIDEEEKERLRDIFTQAQDDDYQSTYTPPTYTPPIYTPPLSYNEPDITVGSYFGCCFTLFKWVVVIASGLIVPYLCYRAIKLVIKAVIKSRRGS